LPHTSAIGPRTRAALDLIATEDSWDEPGQDAVLEHLLNPVPVLALRACGIRLETRLPAWYQALADPAIGNLLRLLHEDPDVQMTTQLADPASCSCQPGSTEAQRSTRCHSGQDAVPN
jgi:hypothetical protein